MVFEAERPKSNVIDLMAALEASVAKMGPGPAGTAPGRAVPGDRGQGIHGPGNRRRPGTGERRARGRPWPGPGCGDRAGGPERAVQGGPGGPGRELDIAGRSKMSKPELIKAIRAAARPKRGARKIS